MGLGLTVFISGFIRDGDTVSSIELNHQGQSVNNSIYTRYQGKIYAGVPSNGDYLMPQADAQSFRSLNQDGRYQDRQFAVDSKHAYCGNLIVPQLKPAQTQALQHNYYSDGQNTVYCEAMSQRNDALSTWQEIKQTWLYAWGLAEKPQTYLYNVRELPQSKSSYRAILDADILTNGEKVYYKGLEMLDANAAQLEPIPLPQLDQSVRLSYKFHRDQKSVYYKQDKLPIPSHADLYSFNIDGLDQDYLVDPHQGQVVMNNLVFDPKFAPYQLISRAGDHVHHALFLSKHGVYYYDNQAKQLQRAGDNPFLQGGFKEIAPLIFSYNNQTYYLQDLERWGSSKGPGLISRSTVLYQLEDEPIGAWQKIADVTTHHYAEIWKKGDQYYYFDQLGSTQLIRHTIYRISDQATLNALRMESIGPDDIRKLTRNEKLIPVKSKEIVKATTQYRKMLFGFIALPY